MANFVLANTYATTFRSALFYNRPLTAQEILDNYNVQLANPAAGFEPVLPFSTSVGVSNIGVTLTSIPGATGYRLTLQQTGASSASIVKNNFTDLDQKIVDLIPETEYTISLFSTFGLVYSSTVTTLANTSSSYDVNEFAIAGGGYDLSTLSDTSVGYISEVMNLFTEV